MRALLNRILSRFFPTGGPVTRLSRKPDPAPVLVSRGEPITITILPGTNFNPQQVAAIERVLSKNPRKYVEGGYPK